MASQYCPLPHGSSRFKISNNILIGDITGPWNMQGLQQAHKRTNQAIADLCYTNFGAMMIVRGVGLYTPDAEIFAHQAIATRADSGGRCIAFIYSTEESKSISLLQLMRLYNSHGIKAQGFSSVEPAISWMAEHGYVLDKKSDLTDWL